MKSNKAAQARKSPMIRLVGLEAAVAATGLAGPVIAMAAPGDLDPSFGQVGRRADLANPGYASLRSVDVRDDDSVLFGGGGEYDYYYSYVDDFVGSLLPDGTTDPGFAAATFDGVAVYDTALQADGKLVGVGTIAQPDGNKKLLLFRLLPDGALDTGFGLNGRVVISDGSTSREAAHSVIVDASGNIVVAGGRGDKLLVARTNTNGTLDSSFGTGGVFSLGPQFNAYAVRIAGAPAGGYRLIAPVLNGNSWDCRLAGVTAAGALDLAFGTDGFASPPSGQVGTTDCAALAVQGDGRIVVGGNDGAEAFVGRLLPNGAPDTAFDATAVPARLKSVSALGVGATGKIFVAGLNPESGAGAQVLRLQSDGALDPQYGNAGIARVDPELRRSYGFWLAELKVASDDAVVLAGNTYSFPTGGQSFVARLLGDTGSGGPGVLSVVETRVLGTEGSGQAVVKVHRTGGSTGAVAVSYDTRAFPWAANGGASYSPGESASVEDYTATTGRLSWADGDTSEREIVVPIPVDGQVEQPEWFEMLLLSPEGGAGLGFHSAEVEIAGSGYPYGHFSIFTGTNAVREGETTFFYVSRDFYQQGAVSVTVRVAAGGTATAGDDFRNSGSNWQDVVLTWNDGESGQKVIQVPTVGDSTTESAESFTLELVSATGGALVGSPSQATVQIDAQTARPDDPPRSRNGGGAFGWLSAMLLGLAGALRRRRLHG